MIAVSGLWRPGERVSRVSPVMWLGRGGALSV